MKDNDFLSITILPPKGNVPRNLKFKTTHLKWGLTLILLIFIAAGISVYMYLQTELSEAHYKKLQQENLTQKTELIKLDKQLNDLSHDIKNLLEKEEEIRLILGDVKLKKRSYKKKLKRRVKSAQKKYTTHFSELKPSKNIAVGIQEKFNFIQLATQTSQENFSTLSEISLQFKERFKSTPSIRPLYGRIQSRYGWRYHPIRRRKKFHKGIDIAAWQGAPIHSTADGIVEFSGWSGTFGYVIVINHDYGYRTIYAHCSQLLSQKGELVKKGQIIAQVGSTGISTGPHLHYEIRKWRQSVNPVAYIDVDLFTASTKLW